MPDIMAASSTTNISSLPSRENLLNHTADPLLSAFTIDLKNLHLIYVSNHSVFFRSLSRNESKEFYLSEKEFPLEHVSSYQNFAISYVREFMVITEMVLPFVKASEYQELLDTTRLRFVLTANSMFQESRQPLPGQFM